MPNSRRTGPEERIRQLIRERGPIPFARFMEEALYGEGGYYSRSRLRIGYQGDFVTGSSVSPLFGRCTTRLLRRMDLAAGKPVELFEAGYGSGFHLGTLVEALGDATGRRIRAWDRVSRPLPRGIRSVSGLDEIAAREIEGVIFSYELFDALPVHRIVRRSDDRLGELWVDLAADDAFQWYEGELSDPSLESLLCSPGASLRPGQVADLSPAWRELYRSLANRLGWGLLVTCDYGYRAHQLLDFRVRPHGTLACYRHHRAHRDPFRNVGRQDLTAHVDFTGLEAAGEEAGLETVALTRQALWLAACGLFEDLQGADLKTRVEAMALLDPEGMGEEIRVLVQARQVDAGEILDLDLLKGGSSSRSRAP